jgi:hypothetical protein
MRREVRTGRAVRRAGEERRRGGEERRRGEEERRRGEEEGRGDERAVRRTAGGRSALGSTEDRARRGCSGALNPQSALAGLNSPPRGSAPVAPPLGASMARVPRGVGS